MAVDTATKRYSMIQFSETPLIMPVPDGTVDAGDRLFHLSLYSGIAADAPPAGGGSVPGSLSMMGIGV